MTDITLKISDLLVMHESFEALAKATFPAKTSYWIGKMAKKVKAETQHFHDTRNALLQRLGKPDEKNPGMFAFATPEIAEEFSKEVNGLMNENITLNGMAVLKLSDFGNIDCKPSVIAGLEPIIEEDNAKP